jgi:tRNA(Ile)-lysidine synthase
VSMAISDQVLNSVRSTGLVETGARALAMLSGGADSVCLVHVMSRLAEPGALAAVHVNHGLRPAADADERFCLDLCGRLGLELAVERVEVSVQGNLEAAARTARYAAAERARERLGCGLIASGHTATDQLETMLFRLASSPGRRALLGIRPRSGVLVRPLLGVTRDQTREYCEEAGLAWREDETNLDRSLARNRLRLDVLPALREIHPAVERNALSTIDQLTEEAELLEVVLDEAAERVGAGGHPPAVDAARLGELAPALRRLLLRRLAEQAAGAPLALSAARVGEIERLASGGGSRALDLGDGVRVVSEYGVLRFQRASDEREPLPARLAVPGSCRFGDWHLVCELEAGDRPRRSDLGSADEPLLDAAKLGAELTVRAWRQGDRMRPLGLGGTKSLQDLFTDRKVPRSLRHRLPVVECRGEIAWVAGVAVSDRFKINDDTERAARLRASASARE